jgi:hypothetical protein
MKPEDNQAAMRQYKAGVSTSHRLHHHVHHQWSRRRFLQASGLLVGAVAAGLPWGKETVLATKPVPGLPKQLTGFSPVLESIFGVKVPHFLPPEVDPFAGAFDPVSDPLIIGDFNGSFGLIEANGVSDPNHNFDGVPRRRACDVRFVLGEFRDRAGRTQRGAFGLF